MFSSFPPVVAQRVVDLGQHVEFDEHHGAAPPGGDRVLTFDVQTQAVVQLGDRVVPGVVLELLQETQIVQRGPDVAAQGFQQLQVLVPKTPPTAQPVAHFKIAAVAVLAVGIARAQRNDQHVPGIAVGQRGHDIGVRTAVGGGSCPTGDSGGGEQRIRRTHRRFVQFALRPNRHGAQRVVPHVQPQHGDLGVQLIPDLLEHTLPVVDGRADVGDLPAEAVHPCQVGVLAKEQEVGAVEHGQHGSECNAQYPAIRPEDGDGVSDQREGDDCRRRQH